MRRLVKIPAGTPTEPEEAPESSRFVSCGVCCRSKAEHETISLFRDDEVVFAVCHECTRDHDIVMRPSLAGVQVLAKTRASTPPPSEVRLSATARAPRNRVRRTAS